MRSWLASPRRRRRLIRIGAGLAVVGCAGLVAVTFWNPGGGLKIDTSVPTGPLPTQAAPPEVKFTHSTERSVSEVLRRFVATAVTREDVPASYDLTTPSLHQGMSRSDWAKGSIPVQPYPARSIEIANVIGSYKDDVQLEATLVPRPHSNAPLETVQTELKAVGSGAGRRWLVDSFDTTGVLPGGNPPPAASAQAQPPKTLTQASKPYGEAHLGGRWLLLPAALLGLIALIPISLGIVGWHRRRQAYRRWASE